MAKRNKKATRSRLVPRPVETKGQPLPAETRARLALRLARVRGEVLTDTETERDDALSRASEAETRLHQHHQGGRKLVVNGVEYVGEARKKFCAGVWNAVRALRAKYPAKKNDWIYEQVAAAYLVPDTRDVRDRGNTEKEPSPSWVYQRCREHEEERTKKQ